MKHSYLLAGTTLENFVKLLAKNGFSLYPDYFIRILFLLQNGLWASLFKMRKNQKFGKILKNHPVPRNPVFIIGHWRTGSTFLHQLMDLDDQFAAPTVFQVSIPDSFLVSRKYYEPVMSRVMRARRPMDNVKLGFDEPQEDEYALLKLTLDSPLVKLIFPESPDYFLKGYENFNPSPEGQGKWEKEMLNFCRKLDYASGKRIIFKNPFHSMRIQLLIKMFPDARFIHIHRHPYKVVPSTINMWNIVGKQNRLKKRWKAPEVKDVVSLLDKMYDKVQKDLSDLNENFWYEIQFEQFEKNPKTELQKMYNHFNWDFTSNFETGLESKLASLKDYKKNKYSISEKEKELIYKLLKKQFAHYNYTK